MNLKSIAEIISLIENNSIRKKTILTDLYPKIGNAHRIGVTGPPGAGKSSLINSMIAKFRAMNKTVAVICIDPTSPFSGGAILGDRIRMLQHYSDEGVFIRSMASRNALGGLSLASSEVADILDAHGFDIIIFETLGVGQVEIDVMNESDTVAVILVPESGDDIQMMKSGLIEIADMYIINKSDRPGADRLVTTLNNMLETNPSRGHDDRSIPVLKTNAMNEDGVDDFIKNILDHFDFMKKSGILEEKNNDRYRRQVKSIVRNRYEGHLWKDENKIGMLDDEISKEFKARVSPNDLADIILKDERY